MVELGESQWRGGVLEAGEAQGGKGNWWIPLGGRIYLFSVFARGEVTEVMVWRA
jgi:hypothetical protein